MDEIEVKILEVNREEIEEKLTSLGAEKVFDGDVKTVYFDASENQLPKNHETLRLRQMGEKTILTLKKKVPKKGVKLREELEVEVSGFLAMKVILSELGYKESSITRKHRVSYYVNDVHFDFDNYLGEHEHIPELLEIESEDEDLIWDYVAKLGFTKKDCKTWAAGKLFKKYEEKNKKTTKEKKSKEK